MLLNCLRRICLKRPQVKVVLIPVNTASQTQQLNGICLDDLDIEITDFALTPQVLKNNTDTDIISETLFSHCYAVIALSLINPIGEVSVSVISGVPLITRAFYVI